MKTLCKSALLGAALCAAATTVCAQEIQRLNRTSPVPAIADATVVPPGDTTYYLSGALPSPIMPAAEMASKPSSRSATCISRNDWGAAPKGLQALKQASLALNRIVATRI